MLKTSCIFLTACLLVGSPRILANEPDSLRAQLDKFQNEILLRGRAYDDLKELLSGGPRLSGSKGAANSVLWAKKKMESYGFDKVWLQPVLVPKWERGSIERAQVLKTKASKGFALEVTALGSTIGTPKGGLTAQVIEVKSVAEMKTLADKVKGKIVFFNRPMDLLSVDPYEAYGGATDQRSHGPRQAAEFGAVGALTRSLTMANDHHPHTGITFGAQRLAHEKDQRIPSAALSTAAADRLSAELARDGDLRVKLELSAKNFEKVLSHNVIGEVTGSLQPEEIVLVGAHLDSWDLSPGAHDDGSGVVQSIEILRAVKAAGLRPRRTLRAVLFMAEEVGGEGAEEYARVVREKNEKHLAAIEADNGGFSPRGFRVSNSKTAIEKLKNWSPFFTPLHAGLVEEGYAGVDIDPLKTTGTALFGLRVETQRYFDYHHSAIDTLDKVHPRELLLGAAASGTLALLLSEKGL